MYYSTKFYASTQKCKVFCLAAPLLLELLVYKYELYVGKTGVFLNIDTN